jgi:hypothetical protein
MNEPGRTDWEGMATATQAAAAGEYKALAYAKVSPSLSQVRLGDPSPFSELETNLLVPVLVCLWEVWHKGCRMEL